MKRLFAALATTTMILMSGAAFAAAPPGPPPGPPPNGPRGGLPPEALAKFLKLTDSQKSSIDGLRATLDATVRPLAEQARAIHQKIDQALQSGADAGTIGQLVIQAHGIEQQIHTAHQNFEAAFTSLLSDEQKVRFAIYKEIQDLQRPPEPPPGSNASRR